MMPRSLAHADLLAIAHRVRDAIEDVPPGQRPVTMRRFPKGACGDTCLLLGAYLVDCGVVGFQYVCASRGSKRDDTWVSHAWLQKVAGLERSTRSLRSQEKWPRTK